MADQPDRSKARRGERCPNCGHRKYRIDNGLRFCRNCGTQVEGYVQYDMGDDADAGLMGIVSRQKKEKHEKERRHLSGLKGKSLYLEALQLVLRHQLEWLIRDKGCLPELNMVVRDLWAVRIAGFPDEVEDGSGDQGSQMFSSGGFSSGGEEGSNKVKRAPHAKSWDPESSSQWPTPSMIDTLAICYLGCLLLRLPTSISDFHQWANTGNIPFRAVYYSLPQEMQDRMPAEFTKQLKRPSREQLTDTSLHHAVFDLVCSFHLNHKMVFPPPNPSTTLVQFVKTLALPVETAVVAMHLSSVLQLVYQFPINRSRVHIVDHPEILMMALLIVSAKLCYPLDGNGAALSWIESMPQVDWKLWNAAYTKSTAERPRPEHEKFDGVTATEVAAMTSEELDGYLIYLAGRHDHRNDSPITAFFPRPVLPAPAPPTRELSAEEIVQRAKTIICETTSGLPRSSVAETSGMVSESRYVSFTSVEGLSETARGIYQAGADISGTSLRDLTRAIRMLENKLMVWGRDKSQPQREDTDLNEGPSVFD